MNLSYQIRQVTPIASSIVNFSCNLFISGLQFLSVQNEGINLKVIDVNSYLIVIFFPIDGKSAVGGQKYFGTLEPWNFETVFHTLDTGGQLPHTRSQHPVHRRSTSRTPEANILTPEAIIRTPEDNILTPVVNIRTPEVNIRAPEDNIRAPEAIIRIPEVNIRAPEDNIRTPEDNILTPVVNIRTPEVNIRTPEVFHINLIVAICENLCFNL